MGRKTALLALWFSALAAAFGAGAGDGAPTVEEIRTDADLLLARYQAARSVAVEEYYFREDVPPNESASAGVSRGSAQEDLYVVRSGTDAVYIKKDSFRLPQLAFKALAHSGAALVCLPNPSGGNGWRANPWFVVSQHPLALLGQVSGVADLDGDGLDDLVVTDDVWESDWPQMGHVDAPCAEVLYCVRDGALAVDREATRHWALRRMELLNRDIRLAQADADGELPLAPILTKFLCYRAAGLEDSGWQELRQDLRAFAPDRYPAADHGSADALTADDVERRIAESLERRGPLEEDLEAYVGRPLHR